MMIRMTMMIEIDSMDPNSPYHLSLSLPLSLSLSLSLPPSLSLV